MVYCNYASAILKPSMKTWTEVEMAMPGDSISISSIAETKWQGWRLFGGNVMFMQVFVDTFLKQV